MAVLRLGFEYLASLELTQLGTPLLNRLCDELRTPCNLVVRDGRSIVYVAKVAPPTPFASSVTVGTRLPAHATVLGPHPAGRPDAAAAARALPRRQARDLLAEHAQDRERAVRHGAGRPPARLRAGRGLLRIEHLQHCRAGARPQRPHRGGAGRHHHRGHIEESRMDEMVQRVRVTADEISGLLNYSPVRTAKVVPLRAA
jgi:hypothetical protein